jgi:putative NIF3 family GTP cyclohydrolase 1 type 2
MPTIQAVIDHILSEVPGAPFAETVDVVVAGDPTREVTGVVTTFLASWDVLQQAIALEANFIISHETSFYNHQNRTDWLADNAVYLAKKRLIDEAGLVIWRLHDTWHRRQPDGILIGMLHALEWTAYSDPAAPTLIHLPPTRLADLAAYIERRLGCRRLLVLGDADQVCSRAALLVGAQGAERHIKALSGDVDVLIVGEVNEWETPEYVRDARGQGEAKALIVTGHQPSEEAGMAYLVEWLQPRFPEIKMTHIPSGDPFQAGM